MGSWDPAHLRDNSKFEVSSQASTSRAKDLSQVQLDRIFLPQGHEEILSLDS